MPEPASITSASAEQPEAVDHPRHYGGDTPYETIKVLEAWLSPEQAVGFCRGNAIKYLSRAGKKGVDPLDDLRKAEWYVRREIDLRERLERRTEA